MTFSFRLAGHTIAAAVLSLAATAAIAAPAVNLTAGSINCGASTTTSQPGYLACLGSFVGNMDNQLTGANGIFAKISSDFHFNTTQYYSSENFNAAGNPFSQNEGNNDDGILNFDRAQTGKFVIGIKQANAFSLYLFDASYITGGLNQIAIDSNGVQRNGGRVISHAGYFGNPTSPSPIPEPASYAMMLGGLALLSAIVRRRETAKLS